MWSVARPHIYDHFPWLGKLFVGDWQKHKHYSINIHLSCSECCNSTIIVSMTWRISHQIYILIFLPSNRCGMDKWSKALGIAHRNKQCRTQGKTFFSITCSFFAETFIAPWASWQTGEFSLPGVEIRTNTLQTIAKSANCRKTSSCHGCSCGRRSCYMVFFFQALWIKYCFSNWTNNEKYVYLSRSRQR